MRTATLIACCLAAASTWPAPELAQSADSILIRGKPQAVHVYGQRGQPPIVVSSGDGGWIHLAPHVAEVLASHGFFVAGIDAKAYLSSFTSRDSTLRPQDEPRDYRLIASYAAGGSSRKPILVGVSEGAGLSVLAATDPETRKAIGGVIAWVQANGRE